MITIKYFDTTCHNGGERLLIAEFPDGTIKRFRHGNNGAFTCGMAGDGVNFKSFGEPFPASARMAILTATPLPVPVDSSATFIGSLDEWPENATHEQVDRLVKIRDCAERSKFADGNNYLEVVAALLKNEPPVKPKWERNA